MEQQKVTPRFFFITLGVLIALITSTVSLLNLLFGILDNTFPDVLSSTYSAGYYPYAHEGLRGALSTLIIFFPIYIILERQWSKISKGTLSRWDGILRKWSLYLILFLSAITILIDLVVLVRYFVGGEITIRFILKVAATLIVAGLVGWHYLRSLYGVSKKAVSLAFTIAAIAIFFGTVVWGFIVIGGPASQRSLKLDQRRLDDLRNIQGDVISFWQQTGAMPETLTELSALYSGHRVPVDPEFQKGNVYEYSLISKEDLKFELCATFAAPLPEGWVTNGNRGVFMTNNMATTQEVMPDTGMGDWQHDAGRACFERTIDTRFYKPIKNEL